MQVKKITKQGNPNLYSSPKNVRVIKHLNLKHEGRVAYS